MNTLYETKLSKKYVYVLLALWQNLIPSFFVCTWIYDCFTRLDILVLAIFICVWKTMDDGDKLYNNDKIDLILYNQEHSKS